MSLTTTKIITHQNKLKKIKSSPNVILPIIMKPCKFGMRECECGFLKNG
jgi:hypothetical protein